MDEGYFLLIYAIIEQAVKDYRSALKRLKEYPADYSASDRIREVQRFFRSDWFYFLSGIDGEAAIKEIEKWDGSL